jgi:hypothetical protein
MRRSAPNSQQFLLAAPKYLSRVVVWQYLGSPVEMLILLLVLIFLTTINNDSFAYAITTSGTTRYLQHK